VAILTLEYDTITQAAAVCKKILHELEPALAQFREIYDAGGGVKETLTQEDLDGVASFSGLTKAQCDDALYALTALLLPAIEQSTTALSQLAARDRGFAPPLPVMMPPAPVA
jgi:hypothetical protein